MNTDKKEFVCPWCVGQVAKLWEWAANPHGSIFTMLLRKSSGSGGGDYGRKTVQIDISKMAAGDVAGVIAAGVAQEGKPLVDGAMPSIVGRWAGDHVSLVGDYDESGLWSDLYGVEKSYRNVSDEVVDAWNDFIDIDQMKLKHTPCSSCTHKGR